MERMQKSPQEYMRMALELAGQGEGKVSPNPMVGCVVVKDGRIIAKGYHEHYGGFHAERNALLHCQEDPRGAELYVNLEPCCHYGKTPPCTEIILEKKIKKVYVGCLDPNPKVAGKGVKILRNQGVEVETGILEEECQVRNEIFFHYVEHKMPFTAMKYAMTLDGKIACETGDSKWVTGKEARNQVQCLRSRYRGIMAGIGTVLNDNPMLNCRMEGGRSPVRIICDARLRLPKDSQIAETAGEIETILAWNAKAAAAYHNRTEEGLAGIREYLEQKGIVLLEVPLKQDDLMPQLDLRQLFQSLGERSIDSILLEGGGTLNASALRQGLVQRVYAFVAPKLVAGAEAKSPVEGEGIPKMKDAVKLTGIETAVFGEDFCITGRIGKEKPCLLGS